MTNINKLLERFTFITGVIRNSEISYLVGSDNTTQSGNNIKSKIFEYNSGVWYEDAEISFPVVSSSICRFPIEQLTVIGPKGEAVFVGSGDIHFELIPLVKNSGSLRAVKGIQGNAYAVGMQRQVYKRTDKNSWLLISDEILSKDTKVCGFEDIDGFSIIEIYAVGWDGEIFIYNGEYWEKSESPTNLTLSSVCCAENGTVYIAGQLGTLIVGRNHAWTVIEQDVIQEDIWSLTWFHGSLYIGTMKNVYTLNNGTIEIVKMTDNLIPSTFRVTQNSNLLWSIGSRDVLQFDGKEWKIII